MKAGKQYVIANLERLLKNAQREQSFAKDVFDIEGHDIWTDRIIALKQSISIINQSSLVSVLSK